VQSVLERWIARPLWLRTTTGFFMLMGVAGALDLAFERLTGRCMGELCGWVWTMVWTVCWGTLMTDGWARRGIVASDFFPDRYRPGKWLVDMSLPFRASGDN
jgi:hypothetical protein